MKTDHAPTSPIRLAGGEIGGAFSHEMSRQS